MTDPAEMAVIRSGPRPRPSFSIEVAMPPAEVLARIREGLTVTPSLAALHLDEDKIDLLPAEDQMHIWSPQLSIVITPQSKGSQLRARFGPHPHVWALYLACYAVSILLAIGCAMFGISQLVLGHTPWALYLTPVAILLAGLVYGASYVGQGLGSAQMCELRHFLSQTLEKPAPRVEGHPPPHD